jgi:hypothetical protein
MKAPLAFAAAMTLLSAAHTPAQAQPVRSQDPPAGSYLRSCRDIDVRGGGRDGVLIADCRDSYDRWRTSTLRYGDCRDDIANVGGVLTCRDGGYGGGYGGGGRPGDGWDGAGRGGSVTLFTGPNFQGPSFSSSREFTNLPRQDNDKALSLRVERGAWEVCSDANFGGRCQVFTRDVPDLRAHGLGGAISSVRPVR